MIITDKRVAVLKALKAISPMDRYEFIKSLLDGSICPECGRVTEIDGPSLDCSECSSMD